MLHALEPLAMSRVTGTPGSWVFLVSLRCSQGGGGRGGLIHLPLCVFSLLSVGEVKVPRCRRSSVAAPNVFRPRGLLLKGVRHLKRDYQRSPSRFQAVKSEREKDSVPSPAHLLLSPPRRTMGGNEGGVRKTGRQQLLVSFHWGGTTGSVRLLLLRSAVYIHLLLYT